MDNCLITGKESSVSNLLEEFKKYEFNLKIEKNVVEYLSCYIVETKNEGKTHHGSASFIDSFDSKIWRGNQRNEEIFDAWYSQIQNSKVYKGY